MNRNEYGAKKIKNDFERDFSKMMNNTLFGKAMESIRKHRHYSCGNRKKNMYPTLYFR